MKRFLTLTFYVMAYCQTCFAQFSDDFSDNNFTTDPAWVGEQEKFAVNAEHLKLQAPAATGTSYISTLSASINNATWELYLQMDFNPSNTNLVNIYLVSDQEKLSSALHGYFVKAGNTADEVSLYRQDGTAEVKIIDGLDGRLNLSIVKTKIKVTRDADGNWQLYSDVGITGTYTLEGVVTDNVYTASNFFGINCKYTETRSDKFRFDDFSVIGDPFIDKEPPALEKVVVISANELSLTFSENLNLTVAESQANYFVSNDVGVASSAKLNVDQRTVQVSFDKNFPNGISCSLSVSNVKDLFGNQLTPSSKPFLYFQPTQVDVKDIVITEIMADPNPQVGLPNTEFIEILNKSVSPIDVGNWRFAEGSSPEKFSAVILLPGEYVIITAASSAPLFSTHGKVIGLNNFPTQNNASDVVVLKDANGITIDSVQYSDRWYKDDDKKQGGWTLELIDPMNTCAGEDNWIASEDSQGGTPGKQNSVYANKPDLTGPKLISAMPISKTSIVLTFDEKLERNLPSLLDFNIEPFVALKEISFVDASLTSIKLTTGELLPRETYSLILSKVYDCAGNTIQADFNRSFFGLAEGADSLDFVINEVLFNPKPTGVDFLEVYNRSSKYINLKNWSLANFENETLLNFKTITTSDFLIKPFSYEAFTADIDVLKGEYPQAQENNFVETTLPSMNDDEGSIALLDENKNIIDVFRYSDKMHSLFIKESEGVSLERITFNNATNDPHNWKSASSSVGFATPGYINSNSASTLNGTPLTESVQVEPEIFIPASGKPDFAEIKYSFAQGGNLANVKIYDTEGREIKQLANNEVLGTEGFFRWDGDQNNGNKARVGYYVVNFEIVNASGSVKTFRKRVIITTQF